MSFSVREVFATLQGEGSRAGQPAIFVRLAGCNLWSGHEAHRARGRGDCAAWCDTQFVGGDLLSGDAVLNRIRALAAAEDMARPLVVFSGGEPLLQLARLGTEGEVIDLMDDLRAGGAQIALETNGTREMPPWLAPRFDHVTVSPKGLRGAGGSVDHLRPMVAQDLKIVVPCPMLAAELIQLYPGATLYFQPRDDGDGGRANLDQARHLAAHFGGRVSIQTHKLLGLP